MRKVPLRLWMLSIVSALLQALPFAIAGPVPTWRRAFCWIALAPFVVAILPQSKDKKSLRAGEAFWIGYACGVLFYLVNCWWIYQTMYLYGGLEKPVAIGVLLLFGLYLGLYHALFSSLLNLIDRRAGRVTALLLAPFLWVVVELARARVTGFPWDLLGYAQVDNLALVSLAPIGGVMLLSFLIAGINVVFAAAYVLPARRKLLFSAALSAAVLCEAGLLYQPPADPATRSATLLQENIVPGSLGHSEEQLSRDEKYKTFILTSKSPRVLDPASQSWQISGISKPDLIVWPEAPADFFSHDPFFRTQVGSLAHEMSAPVITGSVGVDFDRGAEGGHHLYGSATVFDGQGNYFGRYDKIHLVPWGEYVPYKSLFSFAGKLTAGSGNFEPGTQRSVFSLNGHKTGIFICYESIFGDEVREFPLAGADILVNISDDGWYGDTGAPWQHLDMERMRAIENHRWILRDTNTGITTSVDPHGRGVFTTPRHTREAFSFSFDYLTGTTFYTRHGDWFAWLCVLTVVVTFGALGFRKPAEVH